MYPNIVVAFIDKVNGFYETWRSKYPILWNNSNLSLDLTSDEVVMVYTDQLKGVVVYDLQGDFANPSVTWDEYVDSTDYGNFVKGDENYLCDVFSHYLSILPKEISIEKSTDPKYKGFDKLHSWIRFEGEFFKCIKFLYITEHRISVES
ncbi:MAG: hypothetical protein DRP01_06210 [Archaeoglobales archaeon]|nr:MAG: hypothetical protein DRP01_06210 [Archaeoglobales archaeon]